MTIVFADTLFRVGMRRRVFLTIFMGGDGALKVVPKDINKYDIFVIRIDKNGNLAESSPCRMCVNMMKQFNIRRVYYSTREGNIVYSKVNDMTGDPTGTTLRVMANMPLISKIKLGLL